MSTTSPHPNKPKLIEGPQSSTRSRADDPLSRIKILGRRFAPHEDMYHFVLTIPWWQFFAYSAAAFLLVNLLFAAIYLLAPGSITNVRPGSLEDAFYFSVQTMATIGYGVMSPGDRFGHVMVVLQALTGIFSVALITGITFAKFARPSSRVLFAEKVAVGMRDGVPHMMFRMANWRHNQVSEAQLRVMLLVVERTREGETMRRPMEVKLLRPGTGIFALTWTAMHVIDEQSPFHGPGALSRLKAMEAEMFLMFTGIDQTISQTIHARHRYRLDDIVWNGRYADVITNLPDGTRQLDYSYFHEIVDMPDSARMEIPD